MSWVTTYHRDRFLYHLPIAFSTFFGFEGLQSPLIYFPPKKEQQFVLQLCKSSWRGFGSTFKTGKKKKKKKKSPLKLHFFNRDFRGSQQNYKVLSLGYISKSQGAFKTEAWAPPPETLEVAWVGGLGWLEKRLGADFNHCYGASLFIYVFMYLFRAAPVAYGSSQARSCWPTS